jgi:hypothetical protein
VWPVGTEALEQCRRFDVSSSLDHVDLVSRRFDGGLESLELVALSEEELLG